MYSVEKNLANFISRHYFTLVLNLEIDNEVYNHILPILIPWIMLLTHANMKLLDEMYRDKGSRPERFLEKIVLKNSPKIPWSLSAAECNVMVTHRCKSKQLN